MICDKYKISFVHNDGNCRVDSIDENLILANYLMYWGDSVKEILDTLLPNINFGIKYGTEDRYCKYEDIVGLEEKMKKRWSESNLKEGSKLIDIEDSWLRIKEYTGYYVKELDIWLEGIGADIFGIAFVTSNQTIIEGSDIGDKPLALPSLDFKEIVIEWFAFLLRNKEILP